MSGLDPSVMKIWTCRSSSRSGSRNAWTRSKTSTVPVAWANFGFFFWRDPNDFLSRLVTIDETWLYHYDLEAKQWWMEWWHSGSTRPKNSEWKNPLEKFSPRFFGIKTATFSLIIIQRAKLSTRSITHLCWRHCRTFWRKNAAWSSSRGSCYCTTMPRLTGHLQPRRNWPTWASSILITHPILRIWPCRTTICSLDRKNNWKVAIFLPKRRRSLLPWRPGWTDSLLNYFWVASKS